MEGHDKGLLEWRGKPLIAHLHAVTRPITSDLIISCNRNTERYALYADHLVHDDRPDFPGPLAGIRAGLAVARHGWLLVLPCDAPPGQCRTVVQHAPTCQRLPRTFFAATSGSAMGAPILLDPQEPGTSPRKGLARRLAQSTPGLSGT
ncbi:NTP transferase domain-containing protein [Azorhizophilus paspali]